MIPPEETSSDLLDKHVAAYLGDSIYDFDNERLLTWYPRRVLHHAGTATSLLELGIGHGFTTDIFSRHFQRHVVLEGSPAVIKAFRQKHGSCGAEIIETFFESYSTDERFDLIVMGFILEHVDDPLRLLRNFRKFLAPAGRMFVAVPNAEGMNRRVGHLAGLLDNMTALSEHDLLLGHKRYYTVESLRAEVTQANCRIDRLEGIYLKPFTTSQILSLGLGPNVLEALCTLGINYPELCCGLLAEISPQ